VFWNWNTSAGATVRGFLADILSPSPLPLMDEKPQTEVAIYTPRFVVFLDILGFRELVLGTDPAPASTIAYLDKQLQHVFSCMSMESSQFSLKMFSDCISLSCDNTDDQLHWLVREVSFLQSYLAIQGLFVRGGIASGQHFENERMIFSEGLIKAYDLERRAVYPRILVTPEIQKAIATKRLPAARYLMASPDGLCSIDYLYYFYEPVEDKEMGEAEFFDFLEKHGQAVKAAATKHQSDPKTLMKVRWVADYHNFKVRETLNPESYTEAYYAKELVRLLVPDEVFPHFARQI
jgi:hypothetical protein